MRVCDRCENKYAIEITTTCNEAVDKMDLCGDCLKLWTTEAFNRARYIFLHDKSFDVFNPEIRRLSGNK